MSNGLAKLLVWLAGQLPYERVKEVVERVGHLHVTTSQVWRLTQVEGERLRRAAECGMSEERAAPGASQRMGCSVDGGMIHIRGEGWKELKIGDVFEVTMRAGADSRTGEAVEQGRAVRDSYVAHLGGPERFGELLWREAARRHWDQAPETVVVADGAVWIWNLVKTHLYDSQQVVDWYHALQHLAAAGQLLLGDHPQEFRAWLTKWSTRLYQGQAKQIAHMLQREARRLPSHAEALRNEAGYFLNNHRRMQYMQMREQGWPIGSGMVESGCKQFKHRFAGPGMRWSRSGAERLIPIRAAIMSSHFDDLWERSLPPI